MEFYEWFWTRPDKQYQYTPKAKSSEPERWAEYPNDKKILVSTYGRVKKNGRIAKQGDSLGYKVAAGYRVHRLVAITFLSNPDNLPVVNHIDGNKANNHIDNLEWMSFKDNVLHAHYVLDNGMQKTKVLRAEDGYVFRSIVEAAKVMGCSQATIRLACNTGRRAQGFHWKKVK